MSTLVVSVHVNVPLEQAWKYWNGPEHIVHWCHASPDWYTPHAENDLRIGGKFSTGYAARDGSASFDFHGTYTHIVEHSTIEYTIGDLPEYGLGEGRKVMLLFIEDNGGTKITEAFDSEDTHTEEQQLAGWQSILENFKTYAEAQ